MPSAVQAVPAKEGAFRAAPSLSAEVYSLPLEGSRYLIYAPRRCAAFIADAGVVRVLADLEAGLWDESADPDGSLVKFLRSLEILDGPPEVWPVTGCTGDPQPVCVTLLLTTACNLRCTYCYASAGETPARHMSLETARRGIDFVVSNARKQKPPHFEVAYHGGGEPALNWRVLTASFDYARQKATQTGLGLRTSIATNGVLSDLRIDWIIANVSAASVSFDGLPAVHDQLRVTKSGKASSHRVIQTLRRFDQAHFRYGIRMTVTAAGISALPESVEFICANFQPDSIQIEPVYLLGRGHGEASAESGEFIAAFRAAQQRALHYGRRIAFSAAHLGTLTNHFCAASRDSFCLTPDGNVTACYEACSEESPWASLLFYGWPDGQAGGYRFDLGRLNHLRSQTVDRREHCRACFAKWSCGGDCYYKSLVHNGPGEFAGAGRCRIARELTKDQILANIAGSGGLFWHNGRQPGCGQSAKLAEEKLP